MGLKEHISEETDEIWVSAMWTCHTWFQTSFCHSLYTNLSCL